MPSSYTLAELASLLDLKLQGDPNCVIEGLATLTYAKSGQISFLNSAEYRPDLAKTQASAVVLAEADLAACPTNALITPDPYFAYAKLTRLFNNASQVKPGIHPSCSIASSAEIDPSASIAAFCVIGEKVVIGANTRLGAGVTVGDQAELGEDCHLHPRVSIGERVKVGSRVIIHSGAVLGSDGFGFAHSKEKTWTKIYQLGSVTIGNDVEIGANTCIDRGALGNTVIEDGVKLDNLIHIAHNVRVGAHTAIAACTGIAGSVNIGRYCMIGGAVNMNGHITICDGVIITPTSGVLRSIDKPGLYTSFFPAQPGQVWKRLLIRFLQIDNIVQRLKALEKGK